MGLGGKLMALVTGDPDRLGEALRGIVFLHKDEFDFGCYTTFKVNDGFSQVPYRDVPEWFKLAYSQAEDQYAISTYLTDGEVYAGYLWDGDGTLVVGVEGHVVANTDCKKDYDWFWVGGSSE